MHSMFVLNVRTMHSSALRAETGDTKTSERERGREAGDEVHF